MASGTSDQFITSFAVGALVLLQRGRTLTADAPPAATLVSPNGATVAIGKPYFLWNKETTATEYRLKVDNSSSTTVIDSWFLSGAVVLLDEVAICVIIIADAVPSYLTGTR